MALLSATSSGFPREAVHPDEVLLLPKLRRHFAEFLNHCSPDRLGILYLPTCVGLGYGHRVSSLEAFLGSMGSVTSPETARHRVSGLYEARICLDLPLHAYPGTTNARDHLPSCVSPSLSATEWVGSLPKEQPLSNPVLGWARTRWYWNINQLCIDYAFRPRLSSRLTLGGLALPRNPWSYGGRVSHPSLATHAGIRTRTRSTSVSTAASLPVRHSPTTHLPHQRHGGCIRSFGSRLEPRYIVRAGPLDQ